MEETIIFLDFDGVINDNTEEITIESIETLKHLIVENSARVVVIASRIMRGTEESKNRAASLLNDYGIYNIDFLDFNFAGSYLGTSLSSKALGIVNYLKLNYNVRYVILDDENEEEYRLVGLNHYQTPMWTGLRKQDLEKIEFKLPSSEIMNKVIYKCQKTNNKEKLEKELVKVLKRVLKRRENER